MPVIVDELPLGAIADPEQSASNWLQQLEQFLQQRKLSPLEGWKRLFEDWHAAYEYFRSAEQQAFYTATESGEPVTPAPELLAMHEKVVKLLLATGHRCFEYLMTLPTDDEAEGYERLKYNSKLSTLIAGLEETLLLWHTPEPASIADIRQLFQSKA